MQKIINNIMLGTTPTDTVMFNDIKTETSDYRYDLRDFTVNTDAVSDVSIYNDRIIIRKCKPNVWLLKSPIMGSLNELCSSSKNLFISLKGISYNSTLFNRSYVHHSVVGGSKDTYGYIRGLGIFPYSDAINGQQLDTYGDYARNRGELPFSAYVWDSLTLNDGTKVQVASETIALRGDWGARYNGYGKTKDNVNINVLPDYSTFPTPYDTRRLSIGLYTGNAISFDAWEGIKINSLTLQVTVRNEDGVGSIKSAYCYSNFGTITIRVNGLSSGDRLEYGSGVINSSSSSITTDGEYSITYIEGGGFILYGDMANTNPVTITLINDYLDENGCIDISDNPITIALVNEKGINIPSVECWDIKCGEISIYHKDKTIDNCWKKYNLVFPVNWGIHRNSLGTNSNIEWINPLKFVVKKVPSRGFTLTTEENVLDGNYTKVDYKSYQIRVINKPDSVTAKVQRVFTNITTDESNPVYLNNGLNTIEEFSKTVYKQGSSNMKSSEASIVINSDSDIDTNFTIEIVPIYSDNGQLSVNTDVWSSIYPQMYIPEVTDLTNDNMSIIKWKMSPNNPSLWDYIKTWYENNIGVNNNFFTGDIFNGSKGLTEITIKLPNNSYLFGEDNFANSDIDTINFVQTGELSHFSSPQRLLRSAFKLKNINITWFNESDEGRYLCGANTIVDGFSCGFETYPERFINWAHYRSNIFDNTIPCTLAQYAFNYARNLTTIPSYPGTEDENTMIPARGATRMFYGCDKLTTVGPILNAILLDPMSCSGMFASCTSLTSIKIKNLNHGDWRFDDTSVGGIPHIGNLKSLDTESVQYLFSNLMDLTKSDPSKHVDTIDKSFKNWSSAYFSSISESPNWEYTLKNVRQFSCRKRYSTANDAKFIVSTDQKLSSMRISISGLSSGDSIIFGEAGSSPIVTITSNGYREITKEANVTMGFKLLSNNTDNTSVVEIIIENGLDYTNPKVSSANLYCPSEWSDKITSDMIASANTKNWTIYVGGVKKTIS